MQMQKKYLSRTIWDKVYCMCLWLPSSLASPGLTGELKLQWWCRARRFGVKVCRDFTCNTLMACLYSGLASRCQGPYCWGLAVGHPSMTLTNLSPASYGLKVIEATEGTVYNCKPCVVLVPPDIATTRLDRPWSYSVKVHLIFFFEWDEGGDGGT